MQIAGVLLCAGLPAVGIALIIQYSTTIPNTDAARNLLNYETAVAAIAVFFITMVLTLYIVGMLGLALNCVFIYYCFDKRLKTFGIYLPHAPSQIA